MSSNPSRSNPTTDEQASLWAARLDGSVLSTADRAALNAWLAEHPSHREELSRYCQFSADLEQQLPALVESGAVQLPASRLPARKSWRLKLMLGTSLATAAILAFAFWPSRPATQFENLATPVAQRQAITLADGSQVELNAHTAMQVDISRAERHVRLADGEAYFAVSKDASRPFIVETPSGSVRVTGTKFNVRAENGPNLEVTVVEGSVQVRPGDPATGSAPVQLKPGEKLAATAAGVSVETLSAAALEDTLAWRQGQIVFKGVPLREALARFARYHGRGITATADAADIPIGGRFSLDDLDGFFTGLELGFPVRVTRDLNGTVQVSRRSER